MSQSSGTSKFKSELALIAVLNGTAGIMLGVIFTLLVVRGCPGEAEVSCYEYARLGSSGPIICPPGGRVEVTPIGMVDVLVVCRCPSPPAPPAETSLPEGAP